MKDKETKEVVELFTALVQNRTDDVIYDEQDLNNVREAV